MGNARNTGRHLLLAVAALAAVGSCLAQSRDAARLGKDLTPAGGEQAANKDGSIPAYTGAEPPEAGWAWGKLRGEFWKHKGEKALYSIGRRGATDTLNLEAAGLVLVRQRPGSAKGVMFLTMEDETGAANVVVWVKVFEKFRRVLLSSAMLGVRIPFDTRAPFVRLDRLLRMLADPGRGLMRFNVGRTSGDADPRTGRDG